MTLFVACGKVNFTNLSWYSDYSERTYRRQYRKDVEFIRLHAATIEANRDQIAAIDGSFVSKSGSKTWGLDQFSHGSASKAEKGLEISVIAVVDVAAHQGYTLSVQQTKVNPPASVDPAAPSAPSKAKAKGKGKPTEPVISRRVQGYLKQLMTLIIFMKMSRNCLIWLINKT